MSSEKFLGIGMVVTECRGYNSQFYIFPPHKFFFYLAKLNCAKTRTAVPAKGDIATQDTTITQNLTVHISKGTLEWLMTLPHVAKLRLTVKCCSVSK